MHSLEEIIYATILREREHRLRGARGVALKTIAAMIERENSLPAAVARTGGATRWVMEECVSLIQQGKLINKNADIPNVGMLLVLSEETERLLASSSAVGNASVKDMIVSALSHGTADRRVKSKASREKQRKAYLDEKRR